MTSKPGLIARLFGRSQNTVVSKLYTHALGQPLLVHPTMGELLLGAYLDGAVDAPQTVVESAGSIAVINVSGGLVNRPMPDVCGSGPISYASLRAAFDEALYDDNVKAIVFRCDSPGGMASGCFDFTDYVYENRGKKPIAAQIDDMAYSACYAIAAACDTVQVTRTGGGGSVGAYTYHMDFSGANSKAGVVVEYVFAGDKKVDGNPDAPLSDSARADRQKSIDQLYSLFTTSIAKYRGMNVADVVATQAGCYNGSDLVAIGFADSVGTLDDLLANIASPADKPEAPAGAEEEDIEDMPQPTETPLVQQQVVATVDPTLVKLQVKSALTDALASSSLAPAIVKAMLDPKVADAIATAEEIPVRIEAASKIADMCKAAGLESCAADFIKSGTDIETARASLQAAKADVKDELVTALPKVEASNTTNKLNPAEIYRNVNKRGSK